MTKKSPSKKVSTTVYLSKQQVAGLQAIKEQTGVPSASLIRQGIDAILEKNKDLLSEKEQGFEIWQHSETKHGLLLPSLPADEADALKEAGFELIRILNVSCEPEAQRQFIAWCRTQQPDARVERVDFSRLKGT